MFYVASGVKIFQSIDSEHNSRFYKNTLGTESKTVLYRRYTTFHTSFKETSGTEYNLLEIQN